MITNLYDRYFQKSRAFMFPVLGITKKAYTPIQTFLELEGLVYPWDRKLICLYEHQKTEHYQAFEDNLLLGNPLYIESFINPGDKSVYVFNFKSFKEDWDMFLQGKYSQLSPEFKQAIKLYYGESTIEYQYMDTYLFPEKYYDLYSKLLDVDKHILKRTIELCNPFDAEKEKLVFSLNSLNKSDIIS